MALGAGVAGVVILLVGIFVWPGLLSRPEGAYRPELAKTIEMWGESAEPGDELLLADITPFGWDRAVLFGPYVTDQSAQRALGFEWHIERENAAISETQNIVAFALDSHVVAWAAPSRLSLGFGDEIYELAVPRAAARFVWVSDCPYPEAPECARFGD